MEIVIGVSKLKPASSRGIKNLIKVACTKDGQLETFYWTYIHNLEMIYKIGDIYSDDRCDRLRA